MISGWRRDRRIGPPPLHEKLFPHLLRLLVASGAASLCVVLVRLIEIAIPTGRFRDPVLVWAVMFSMLMLQQVLRWWSRSRAIAGGLLLTTVILVGLDLHFGRDILAATGILPRVLVPPVTP